MKNQNQKPKQYTISLSLCEEDGTLIFDDSNNPIITMEGYSLINNIVNASIHMPDSILVDGIAKENPYVIKNEEGEIIEVIANAISFCKFNGGVVSANATVSYNVEVQLTNRLMESINYDREAGHICKHGAEQETGTTIVRRINESLDLIANITNEKVVRTISEYVSDKAMAERKAITLAQRNALRKLPPFTVAVKNIIGSEGFRTGVVSVILYSLNKTEEEISDILAVAKNLNAAIATTDLIEITTGAVTTTDSIDEKKDKVEVVQKDLYSTEEMQLKKLKQEITKYPAEIRQEAGKLLFKGRKFSDLGLSDLSILLTLMKKLMQ